MASRCATSDSSRVQNIPEDEIAILLAEAIALKA